MKKILMLLWLPFLCLQVRAVLFDVPRLSPIPAVDQERRISLDGEWQFSTSVSAQFNGMDFKGFKEIQVPGEWVMQGFSVPQNATAGYVRSFFVSNDWAQKKIKLRCNGIYSECVVYINGKKVGGHLGGFTPFEIDITDAVRVGAENNIGVAVKSESLADKTSNASFYAVHPLGGITRSIFIFSLPPQNISMFHVSTTFDSDYKNAVLKAEIQIANEASMKATGLMAHLILKDAHGNQIPLRESDYLLPDMAKNSIHDIVMDVPVVTPHHWDPEHPYLYTLTCELKDAHGTVSSVMRKIGFRQIEVKGNQVLVNGQVIKLRGVCRHEVMPLRGRSLTGDVWRRDVDIFRKGNVNYIRTSHYPPDEAFLDACDSLGMFVEEEAPFCWAHQTEVPESARVPVLQKQHIEMVNRDRSHPSVLMWSIGNESMKYKEYFKDAAEIVEKMDPTRPRNFSQWGPDADGGMLEIANHHYPGPKGPDQYRNYKRPVVFDEYCHLNAYNRLELAADPGVRSMWGEMLDKMWNNMYHSQGVLGGAIWVGIDDTFFLPDGRTVGYGTWGTIDGWRRKKPEYWGMKKSYSPVKVTLLSNETEDGTIRLHIENLHLFSNLSECKLQWTSGNDSDTISVDMAPRSEGDVEIHLPARARKNPQLALSIRGTRGYEIDHYSFQVLPTTQFIEPAKKTKKEKWDLTESEARYQVRCGNHFYDIDKRTGMISTFVNKQRQLEGGPILMVLPLNGDGDGIQMTGKGQTFAPYNPVCSNWTASSVLCQRLADRVIIVVKGSYMEAEGTYTYIIHGEGNMEIKYKFKLKKDINPRQTGLAFTLPSDYQQLSWDRKGYWNYYPEGDIASLHGTVTAFTEGLPITGLAGPSNLPSNSWSTDQTAQGSNIFRSTKENIYTASLSGEGLPSVEVVSDGTQSYRAWVDNGKVSFLVADYNNAGSGAYLTSHSELGYRPLREGDTVQGTVVLKN